MVQEKRCRRIQPTQGAAGSSFQLKDGGSSIVFAKSTCYQFMMLKEKECWNISPAASLLKRSAHVRLGYLGTCMVVLVGLLQDGAGHDPVG